MFPDLVECRLNGNQKLFAQAVAAILAVEG